ncbi:MAG TPA: DUF1343 domain-containing protein [Flavobacterium sp.]
MISQLLFKNTVLMSVLIMAACGNSAKGIPEEQTETKKVDKAELVKAGPIVTGAENHSPYLPLLANKNVGVLTNQTGILTIEREKTVVVGDIKEDRRIFTKVSVVDFLLEKKVKVRKIFAPEHGFRGTADAGELIVDGKDTQTNLPIISLYGDNKKPSKEQLQGLDVIVFDLQDVGARFYTYISSLHYLMEACAENNIKVIVLDRPNPNGDLIDGPILEKEHTSFVGMHPIPVLHGMTIGEYAKMINGQKWLKNGIQCNLTVIPCLNYTKKMLYSLPVKPSPNLPNDQAVNLYASLCLFEGTNVSVGRGTTKQFQVYGSPFLPKKGYTFTPQPNEGAKTPPYNGQICYGEDLSQHPRVKQLELKWLISAYANTADKSKFFSKFITKLAGTTKLQQQIEAGETEQEIRKTWEGGIASFKNIRKLYEMY